MMVRTVITWSNVVFPRHFSTMKTAGKYTSSTFKQTRTLFSAFLLITSRIPQIIITNLREAKVKFTRRHLC